MENFAIKAFKKLYGRLTWLLFTQAMMAAALMGIGMVKQSEAVVYIGCGVILCLVTLIMFVGDVESPRNDDEDSWDWLIQRYLQK